MATKKQKIDFESSLKDLNVIVNDMEQGKLSLEESLKKFETGVNLIRQCQDALQKAEQKVQVLTKTDSKFVLQDYQDKTNND